MEVSPQLSEGKHLAPMGLQKSSQGSQWRNEKRCGARASSLQFCAAQPAVSCRKDGDFFWTTFLEVLGKYPGSATKLEEQESIGYRGAGGFGV